MRLRASLVRNQPLANVGLWPVAVLRPGLSISYRTAANLSLMSGSDAKPTLGIS
jgi:hypothetical protein